MNDGVPAMQTEALNDADEVARRGASLIAEAARQAVRARGRFLLATSGGTTPWRMLSLLAREDVPWPRVHWFQVDERVAPLSDPARTLTRVRACLLDAVPIPQPQIHAMPVDEPNLERAAQLYQETLHQVAGTPPILDFVHLGLGVDGHTASLVPNDPVLEVRDSTVAVTLPYQGHRRMTLTYAALDRARALLWVVTGPDKSAALGRLLRRDQTIPAGRVSTAAARLLADTAALKGSPSPGGNFG